MALQRQKSVRRRTVSINLTKSSRKDLFILACRHFHRGLSNLAWLKEFKKELVYVEKESRRGKWRTNLDEILGL